MKTLLTRLLAASLALGLTNGIAQNAKPPDTKTEAQKQGNKDCKGLTGNKLELCLKHGRQATDGQPNQGPAARTETQQGPDRMHDKPGADSAGPDQPPQTGGSQNPRKTQ